MDHDFSPWIKERGLKWTSPIPVDTQPRNAGLPSLASHFTVSALLKNDVIESSLAQGSTVPTAVLVIFLSGIKVVGTESIHLESEKLSKITTQPTNRRRSMVLMCSQISGRSCQHAKLTLHGTKPTSDLNQRMATSGT